MEFGDVFFDRASLREGSEFGYGRAYGIDGSENLFKVFDELVKGSKGDWLLGHSLFKVIKGPGLGNSFLHMGKGGVQSSPSEGRGQRQPNNQHQSDCDNARRGPLKLW